MMQKIKFSLSQLIQLMMAMKIVLKRNNKIMMMIQENDKEVNKKQTVKLKKKAFYPINYIARFG